MGHINIITQLGHGAYMPQVGYNTKRKKKQGVQGDGNPPVSPKEASAAALKRTALDPLPVMKKKKKEKERKSMERE